MNMNQDINRPKLKKIKRPINRTAPVGGNQMPMQGNIPAQGVYSGMQGQPQMQPAPRNVSGTMYGQPQNVPNSNELNAYLDGPSNLPNVRTPDNEYVPNYIEEETYDNQPYSDVPAWLNVKVFVLAVVAFLAMGILLGKLIFAQSTVVRNGLQGVVVNTEVPRGRARCGIAERSQGCVLYVMNPQRQEMSAKDFYDIASQMTGRQRFMIETGNMRYANSKIKPGDIVQLNIPPL